MDEDSVLSAPPRDIIGIGSRIVVRNTEGDEFHGWMTERFTYQDGTTGAYVELDDGTVIVVPLAELAAAGASDPELVDVDRDDAVPGR